MGKRQRQIHAVSIWYTDRPLRRGTLIGGVLKGGFSPPSTGIPHRALRYPICHSPVEEVPDHAQAILHDGAGGQFPFLSGAAGRFSPDGSGEPYYPHDRYTRHHHYYRHYHHGPYRSYH